MRYYRYKNAEVSCCYKYLMFSYNIVFWCPQWKMRYYRYKNAEVSCCYKYLMFSYNIVFWLVGAAFLGIGFWAWSEKGVLSDLSQVTRQNGFDPVWVVLVVGTVTFVLGFAGCVGALRENICMLKFFCGVIGVIFFLELTAGVLAFVFQDTLREWISDFFLTNVKGYRDDIDLQNLIDSLQRTFCGVIGVIFFLELTAGVLAFVFQDTLREWISDFFLTNVKGYRDDIDLQNLIDSLQRTNQCCGARNPDDWNTNNYFNCTDDNPSRERCGVPFSCCLADPAEREWNTVIHVKGCIPALEAWLPRNLYIVAGVFIIISLLQVGSPQ
ncbi:UNVERIFIED_CONTAM: hypothetical protein FKN15_075273 [Acipenser sinensis]